MKCNCSDISNETCYCSNTSNKTLFKNVPKRHDFWQQLFLRQSVMEMRQVAVPIFEAHEEPFERCMPKAAEGRGQGQGPCRRHDRQEEDQEGEGQGYPRRWRGIRGEIRATSCDWDPSWSGEHGAVQSGRGPWFSASTASLVSSSCCWPPREAQSGGDECQGRGDLSSGAGND
jgi:hypothetical protein